MPQEDAGASRDDDDVAACGAGLFPLFVIHLGAFVVGRPTRFRLRAGAVSCLVARHCDTPADERLGVWKRMGAVEEVGEPEWRATRARDDAT